MAKKEEKTPVQPIRMYLLKKSIANYVDALRDKVEYDEYSFKRGLDLKGKVFLRRPEQRRPSWASFLQLGISKPLPHLTSTPHAAIAFLEVDGRTVALVFGMGRYMLSDTSYEADFGILAALNAVDPEGLRSADTFQFEAIGVHRRTQTSRTTSLADFEIDPARAHFRSVTGKAKNKDLADKVTGTEGGLGTNVRVKFEDLGIHCAKALVAYRAKSYQDSFPKFENLRRVTDRAKIATLEEKVISRLKKNQTVGIYLSPPEPLDYDDFSGFSLTAKGDIVDELSIEHFLETRRSLDDLDIAGLKRAHIFLRRETSDEPLSRWSVYKSLICELPEGRSVFILMSGEWYRASKTFAGQVEDFMDQIPEVDVGLPEPEDAHTEPEYLAEVEAADSGLLVLDRKLAYCEDAGHGIEVCDVLTTQRDYVHIKRREGGSSSLSHLFLQGKNSALALLRDGKFRLDARRHLKKLDPRAVRRIPKEKPKMGSFRVVFGIMGRMSGPLAPGLPFFSKLSLKTVTEDLAERGVKVALSRIEVPQ